MEKGVIDDEVHILVGFKRKLVLGDRIGKQGIALNWSYWYEELDSVIAHDDRSTARMLVSLD